MANAILAQDLVKLVFPTESDIAEVPTQGGFAIEKNTVAALAGIGLDGVLPDLDGSGFPIATAGFIISTNGGLSFKMSRGRAVIDGYYVEMKAGADITVDKDTNPLVVDASATTIIFLTLREDGSAPIVDSVNSFELKAAIWSGLGSVVVPLKSIPLAIVVSDGAGITSIRDMRFSPNSSPCVFATSTTSTTNTIIKKGYCSYPVGHGYSAIQMRIEITRQSFQAISAGNLTATMTLKSPLGSFALPAVVVALPSGNLSDHGVELAFKFQNAGIMRWDHAQSIGMSLNLVYPISGLGATTTTIVVAGAAIRNFQLA